MTALASYSTGTVSVSAGGTIVSGAGVIWSDGSAKPGDILQIGNFQTLISDLVDTDELEIPPWGGGAQTAAAYKIWQVSPRRFAGGDAMAAVHKLVTALNTSGYFVFVDVDATEPDPSLGDDGQYALQPTTGKMWAKLAGVWTYLGIYKGFNFTGAYNGSTTYAIGDVMTDAGSSYVWINATPGSGHAAPNTTYWQLLASKGDQGGTGPASLLPVAAWVTATAYVVGPPASYVTSGGSSYMCLVAHTSGTFATDLAAGKWGLVAQKGADGSGTVNSVTGGTGLTGGAITTSGTLAVDYASKSDQQTATSTAKSVNPGHQQDHDSAAKAWAVFHWSGSAIVIDASYNISSITRTAAGIYTVNFTTAFATANYCCQVNTEIAGNTADGVFPIVPFSAGLRAAGSCQVRFLNQAMSAAVDPGAAHAVFYGRQ